MPARRKPQAASNEKAAFRLRCPKRAEALKKTTGRVFGEFFTRRATAPAVFKIFLWLSRVLVLSKMRLSNLICGC